MSKISLHFSSPVTLKSVVAAGFGTFDTCFITHPQAVPILEAYSAELLKAGYRAWITADVHYELERLSTAPYNTPDERIRAQRGLDLIHSMMDNDVLIVYSEQPGELSGLRDNPERRVFADDVIMSRVRLHRNIPMVVITQDKPLAHSLLSSLPHDCAKYGEPVHVYMINNDGELCEVSLPAKESVHAPRTGHSSVLPLSQLSPKTAIEDANIVVHELNGSVEGAFTGTTYELGEEIGSGTESIVYAIKDHEDLCVKIFRQPTIFKHEKIRLLAEQRLGIEGAALPIEPINCSGEFIGYVMNRIRGVQVERIMSFRGQQRFCKDWTRVEYVRVAKAIVAKAEELLARGILLGDVSAANFLIQKKEGSDSLDPDHIVALDLDSAQLGNSSVGLFPADGLTPDYLAPEYQRNGVTKDTLRTQSSLSYSIHLLALQLILGGVHPFRVVSSDGSELSIADRIAIEAFPFGVGADHRQAKAATGAEFLWSHNTKAYKSFAADFFRKNGALNTPDKRPNLSIIRSRIEKLLYWMERSEDPEDRSLNPAGYRAYIVTCSVCGKVFDANLSSAEAREHETCDACMDASVGYCKDCGNPLEMTMREARRKSFMPKLCKACHIKALNRRNAGAASYAKCPVCGFAHRSDANCPVTTDNPAKKPLPLKVSGPGQSTRTVSKAEPAVRAEPIVKDEPAVKIKPAVKDEPAVKIESAAKDEPEAKGTPYIRLTRKLTNTESSVFNTDKSKFAPRKSFFKTVLDLTE